MDSLIVINASLEIENPNKEIKTIGWIFSNLKYRKLLRIWFINDWVHVFIFGTKSEIFSLYQAPLSVWG